MFYQMNDCIPKVVKAMGGEPVSSSKLFSTDIMVDDPAEIIVCGEYILLQFGLSAENCVFLVDGYVADGTVTIVVHGDLSKQSMHYHRAGCGASASPWMKCGYAAFCAHEDLPYCWCQWHPYGHHELWQDGEWCISQEYCLHVAGRMCARAACLGGCDQMTGYR